MRIISGQYKNRLIPTVKHSDYRPSTARFKEALFSILVSNSFYRKNPIINANILDLYSGSGSLSFEALSRGAKKITLVDIDKLHLNCAKKFVELVKADSKVKIVLTDALLFDSEEQFDLVFLDPPYNKNLVKKSLEHLVKNNLLNNESIIIIESEINLDLKILDHFTVLKEKKYSNSKLLIIGYEQDKKTI